MKKEPRCCKGCGRDTTSKSGYCYRCCNHGDKLFGFNVSRQYRKDNRDITVVNEVLTMMEDEVDDADSTSSQRYHGSMRDDL